MTLLIHASADCLAIWQITYNTSDYPDEYVARKFLGIRPTNDMIIGQSLHALRSQMQAKGLYRLGRHPDDLATVVECWL